MTAFSDIGDMLQKAHLVIEGTFIYLRDSTEFFIRVRDGWKKLQVILKHALIKLLPNTLKK